jgi:restriction system protein
MKFAMNRNSLFAILLRSPWWASVLVAVAVVAAMRLVLPEVYAFFAAAPFLVVAAVAPGGSFVRPAPRRSRNGSKCSAPSLGSSSPARWSRPSGATVTR